MDSGGGGLVDWSAAGIRLEVSADLLLPSGVTQPLPGLTSLSISRNLNRAVRGGGSLTVQAIRPIDWRRAEVRVWVTGTVGDESERAAVLTGPVGLAGDQRRDTGATVSATISDRTAYLDDVLGQPRQWLAGTVVTAAIREILEGLDLPAAVTDDPRTLPTTMTWPATATWRQVINGTATVGGLLDVIGYAAIWADGMGVLRCEPYVLPSSRPPVFDWRPGPACTYLPELTVDAKTEAPNHIVLTTAGDADTPGLVSELWNDSPQSPYSTVNQRHIPYVSQVEAADQATLDAAAVRALIEQGTPARTFAVKHLYQPQALGDAGRLRVEATTVTDEVTRWTQSLWPALALWPSVWPQSTVLLRSVEDVVTAPLIDAAVTLESDELRWTVGDGGAHMELVSATLREVQ